MADTHYIEMPQPMGLFAGDLYSRGIEYLTAFEKLSEQGSEQFSYVICFLFSHALELLLKSYFAASGNATKEKIKRKLGHDLRQIMDQCEQCSIPHVENLRAFVEHTHEMNKGYDFRYPTGYRISMPKPSECLIVARALAEAIQPIIMRVRVKADLQFASETRKYRGKKIRWSD